MKSFFRMSYLRENLFGKLPFLKPVESMLLRFFMIPTLLFVRAQGLEYIRDRREPVIFAFNHNNSIESILVPAFLVYHSGGQKISFVVDWMYGKIPLIEQIFERMDPVYVYHKRSTLKFLESKRPNAGRPVDVVSLCCEKLKDGKRVGIFPEGKRNKDPFRLLKAKPGIGHIALRSEAPVVPVGINCISGGKKKKVRSLGRISLNIGEPLRFDDLAKAYHQAGNSDFSSFTTDNEQHMLARAVTNRVMSVIAGLCGKEYPFSTLAVKSRNTAKVIQKITTIPSRRSYVLYNG